MICKVTSLKLQIKGCSFLDDIITSSNEIFTDFESDIAEGISKLGNSACGTVETIVIVKQEAGS